MKIIALVFLGCIASASAVAANLNLANDPSTGGPGKFAAGEIRREAGA
jgi:hypothetical protein